MRRHDTYRLRIWVGVAWMIAVALAIGASGCGKKQTQPPEAPAGEKAVMTAPEESGNEPGQANAGQAEQSSEAKDVSGVEIEMADGTVKKIGDYQGKVVLLDFWATYCRPCVEKLPHLQEMQKKYGTDKLAVIAVTLDPDVETAVKWAKGKGMDLPIAKFNDQLKDAFFGGEDTFAIPQARLIGPDGKMVRSWGPDGSVEEIEAAVKELLGTEQ